MEIIDSIANARTGIERLIYRLKDKMTNTEKIYLWKQLIW